MFRLLDAIVLVFYCAFIFWLSHQSSLPAPELFPHQDKVHHFVAYFIMSVFAWRFFRHYLGSSTLLAFASIGFCSLYGVTDEWHQTFINGRSSDFIDWLADTTGASAAMITLSAFNLRKSKIAAKRGKAVQSP